jgi:hypothetical protein
VGRRTWRGPEDYPFMTEGERPPSVEPREHETWDMRDDSMVTPDLTWRALELAMQLSGVMRRHHRMWTHTTQLRGSVTSLELPADVQRRLAAELAPSPPEEPGAEA